MAGARSGLGDASEPRGRLRELHQFDRAEFTDPELWRALVIEARPDSPQGEVLAGPNAAMAAGFEGVRFVAAQGESDR